MHWDLFFFCVAIGMILAGQWARAWQAERHHQEIVDLIDAFATMVGEMLQERKEQ